ncbi:MAG: tRNA (adenosine(37)-N6)-threonylcarbamoyltransferase complex ATPase subunit type 1 TsaE [Flavobacterium sp.]|nr:tRNA (adenosine(37)-N6)-threonylcarbamoyltransferase complex ATPase subunit type 1 TsaE [Flavobacterium sp.]
MKNCEIITANEIETMHFAKSISSCFKNGDVILLDGTLGVGKTQFVKGFCSGYDYNGDVTSPTFTLANIYETDFKKIIHLDLYRIDSPREFIELGIMDYFDESIVLIEWGNKFSGLFDNYFSISIENNFDEPTKRKFTLSSQSDHYNTIIDDLNAKANLL